MIPNQVVLGASIGALAGSAIAVGLRTYDNTVIAAYNQALSQNANTPPPWLTKSLGAFGMPSVLVPFGVGLVAIGVAFYGNRKGKMGDAANITMFTFGGSLIGGGLLNGLFPTSSTAALVKILKNQASNSSGGSNSSIPSAFARLTRSGSSSSL
ncbi:MAG: hypothetical protein QW203_07405 [Thermoplasmatales archaeon]